MGSEFPKIGVLVLSYNHSKLIAKTLSRIDLRIKECIEEIFIFDDNSPDNTYSVIKEIIIDSPWRNKLSVYKNPRNLRYGGNQKVGYQYAIDKGMDYVIMLHGDGQYAPEYIADFILTAVETKGEVIFASRMMKKNDAIKGGMPLYKFLGNQVLTFFENFILGTRLTEFHSGYRMYSTKFLEKIPFYANTDDFHFDTEIIIQCRHLGVPIKEIPIRTFYGDEDCNVNGMQYALNVCKAVLLYRCHQLHFIRKGSYIVDREFIHKRKLSPYSSHEKILKSISPCEKVLCVGDSDGLLYNSLRKIAQEVWVVDSRESEKIHIDRKFYIQKNFQNLNELEFKREFDSIILCDVLPKVSEPENMLNEMKRYLKEDGRLIVSVPNVALWVYRISLAIGRFNYASRGPLEKSHIRFFTKFSIQQSLLNSSYLIKNIEATGLPFEVVFSSSGKSKFIKLVDALYYFFADSWHKLFAYQFVVSAEISSLDSSHGEGRLN